MDRMSQEIVQEVTQDDLGLPVRSFKRRVWTHSVIMGVLASLSLSELLPTWSVTVVLVLMALQQHAFIVLMAPRFQDKGTPWSWTTHLFREVWAGTFLFNLRLHRNIKSPKDVAFGLIAPLVMVVTLSLLWASGLFWWYGLFWLLPLLTVWSAILWKPELLRRSVFDIGLTMRTLRSPEELRAYQRRTEKFLGVSFPLNYLEAARVRCAFDDRGHMMGGYAIQSHVSQIRVLRSLPTTEDLLEGQPVELTGLWLAPSQGHRSTRWRWVFWMSICADFVPYLKRKIVFSYTTSKRHLARMYDIIDPQVLYCGLVDPLEGMTGAEHETICTAPAWKLTFLWLRHPSFFWRRARDRKSQKSETLVKA